MQHIRVIDSHTGGEPTRLVVEGGPDLGKGPLRERLERFRNEFDHIRSAIVNEPRGNDAIVGALLCEPHEPDCSAGVIFFNNVGYLNMCGHGTIGLAVTLQYLGRITAGLHRIDTPVGPVEAELHENGSVTVNNVASYREATGVVVDVPGYGKVTGDIAWGGNWFFLTADTPCAVDLKNLDQLTDYTWKIRQQLGDHIDHIEVFGPPTVPGADSRNFVLCPGKAYDRSPCGTGTSAKLACLAADGKLAPGEVWRQESLIGSIFEGTYTRGDGNMIYPSVTGTAFVNADSTLILNPQDQFVYGIR